MNIIELAKEAGCHASVITGAICFNPEVLERFTDLVRAEALAEPDIEEMTLTQIASRHEPVQEPVAGVVVRERLPTLVADRDIKQTDQRLYAAPVKREWVDLTDDEMWGVFISKDWTGEPLHLMSAVIAAFKEKNK